MLGRDELDSTLLTCDQGNFNQITTRSRNRTLVTVVIGTCTTTVPPTPHGTSSVLRKKTFLNPRRDVSSEFVLKTFDQSRIKFIDF